MKKESTMELGMDLDFSDVKKTAEFSSPLTKLSCAMVEVSVGCYGMMCGKWYIGQPGWSFFERYIS